MVAFAIRAGRGVGGAGVLVGLGALATYAYAFTGTGIMCKFKPVFTLSWFIYKKRNTLNLIP